VKINASAGKANDLRDKVERITFRSEKESEEQFLKALYDFYTRGGIIQFYKPLKEGSGVEEDPFFVWMNPINGWYEDW